LILSEAIMALPTQKRTKSRKRIKQYHLRLKRPILSLCPKCKKPVRPHHLCLFCGTYANQEIIKPKIKEKKKKEKK